MMTIAPELKGQLTDLADIKSFILGGQALFTLQNVNSGNRFTYQVVRPEPEMPYFVKVLSGADNEDSYTFLGSIFINAPGASYRHSKKSSFSADAQSVKVFTWLLERINSSSKLPEFVEFWHEGRCCRCGRVLTVPESIATGIGPVCAGKLD